MGESAHGAQWDMVIRQQQGSVRCMQADRPRWPCKAGVECSELGDNGASVEELCGQPEGVWQPV